MQSLINSPCGELVPTIEGQSAFIPAPIPHELQLSSDLVLILDSATQAVSTLAGVGETVPNPHLLARPFARREAVLSSRIEGTVASLSDVLKYEAGGRSQTGNDAAEVFNYVQALEHGIERLDDLPISYRLVNELHSLLLSGVRGEEKSPGEFREEQVWIGAPGSRIQEARFIPPPPEYLRDLFYDWEAFVNNSRSLPPLVRCALMHYQIETIHPYSDGNGRIGRLMITLFLCATGILVTPLLYLSAYFERDRQRYYEELFNVSATGDWERWISYFLEGIRTESRDVLARIRQVRLLEAEWRTLLLSRREPSSGLQLLEELFANPVVTASRVSELLGVTDPGARRILNRLVDAGILVRVEDTWPNLYVADRLIHEINRPIEHIDHQDRFQARLL